MLRPAAVVAAVANLFAGVAFGPHAAGASPGAAYADLAERVRAAAQSWLDHAEDAQRNGERTLRFIAVRDVDAKPSDPDYVTRREMAFAQAYLEAFNSVQAAMGRKIQGAIGGERKMDEVVGDPELAKALVGLAARGGDAVQLKEKVESFVATAGAACMAGFSVAQSFELAEGDHAAVGVIGTLSPRSIGWVRSGGVDVPADPLHKWFDGMNEDMLCRTYGTRFVPDEKGRMWLVAFGRKEIAHARFAESSRDFAVKESVLRAATALGATVVSRSWADSIAEAKVIQDLKPEWRRVERLEDAIRVTAKNPQLDTRLVSLGARRIRDSVAGGHMWIAAHAVPLGEADGVIEPGFGCPEIPDEMRKSTRQIDARGSGTTYEEAVRSALKDAISQMGVYIEFDERVVRDIEELKEMANSEVSTKCRDVSKSSSTSRVYGDGFIHSYSVVEQLDSPDLDPRVLVRICANIVRFDPDDPRFGKPPTIVVLPATVRRDGVRVAGAPADADSHVRAIEEAIEGCLLDAPKRFKVLDDRNAPQLAAIRERIRQQVRYGQVQPMEAMKLGGALTPDYVVLIDVVRMEFVKANPKESPDVVGPNDRAVAEVRCRIVNVANDGIAPWRGSADITLDLMSLALPARRPAERALPPIDVLRRRAIESIESSLRQFLRDPAARADAAPSGSASVPGSPRLIAVGSADVSLDASSPLVRIGARFAVENPVAVSLSTGSLVERDRVALIEVTEVTGGIAKARVVEGDIDLVNLKSSELVPAS